MKKWEDRFEEYLHKYCKTRNISADEAEEHKIVQEVKKHYEKIGDIEDSSMQNSGWAEYGCCK